MVSQEPDSNKPIECWAEVGALRVRYLDWGGDLPPLVALHGLASSAHWYDPIARLLSPQFRIVAPDQRGHGKTTQAPQGYDWPTVASDVAALMDRLEIQQAAVLGHSWGGHVASALAAHHPERVSRLVMIDGGYLDAQVSPDGTWEGFYSRLGPREVSGTRPEFLDRLRHQLAGCWNDDLDRIVQTMVYEDEEGQIRDILRPDNHFQVIRTMWDYPPSSVLPSVECPALMIVAGPSPERADSEFAQLRRAMVESAIRALKDGRAHWIPDTIHDIGYHKPVELAGVIADFLAES